MNHVQSRRAIFPASLLLLLFLFLRACVPEPIADLELVESRRVPASALPLSADLRGTLANRGDAVWRVSLDGDANWIREIKQHELNSYANVTRCDDRDRRLLSLGPFVGRVLMSYYGEGFRDYDARSRTVRYDVYLPETGRYRSVKDFNAPMPSYDLGRQRIPLCFRIAGGGMQGAFAHSNEVRVEVGRMP